jgi:hypothetical protein
MYFILLAFILLNIIKHFDETLEVLKAKKGRLERAGEDFNKINEILQCKSEYIFYLRDFARGAEKKNIPVSGSSASGIANPVAWPAVYGKKSTDQCIDFFSTKYPLIFLDNSNEKTLLSGGLVIYPKDDKWLGIFQQLLNASRFVVIDYLFSHITENIIREINAILTLNKKNVIFIGDDTDVKILKEKYPGLYDKVLCFLMIQMRKESLALSEQPKVDFSSFEQLI